MTKRGYFIINGVPRVITNQVIRRSGIYHQQSTHAIIKSNKVRVDRRFYVDLISKRGTWLRLEIDTRKRIWARMKKAPSIPALLLLQSIGIKRKTIIQVILGSKFLLTSSQLEQKYRLSFLFNLLLSSKKNTETLLETGRKFICRKFLSPRSYNLGYDGRYQLNSKLGSLVSIKRTTLTPYDLLLSINSLIKLFQNEKNFDDIDNLENRRIRTSGELIQNQLSLSLIRLEKKLIEKIKKTKSFLKIQNLFSSKALNSTFKEFFGSNPLSQFLDQANPLAELTHKRRLTSVGPGGINKDTAGMAVRGIHPTHYGKICPIETPEGQNAGLVNSLTVLSSCTPEGFFETPFFAVYKGQIQNKLGAQFLSSGFTKNQTVALNTVKSSLLQFLPNLPFAIQTQQKFKKLYRRDVNYIITSCFQLTSIATSLIPFLEHDDANRALMGSNMQRQAVPLAYSKAPLVGTGFEHYVLFYCGDFLQLKESGVILYSSHEEIRVFNFIVNPIELYILNRNNHFLLNFNYFSQKFNSKIYLTLKQHLNYLSKTQKRKIDFSKIFCFQKNLFLLSKPINNNYNQKSLLSFTNFLCAKRLSFLKNLSTKIKLNQLYFFTLNFFKFHYYFNKITATKPKKVKKLMFSNNINFIKIKKINSIPLFLYKKNFNKLKSKTINSNLQTRLLLNIYSRSNQGTCLIQKPYYLSNKWVQKGELLTYNFSCNKGELALGQNVFVAYLPWEGFNFEDAILISEKLIYNDTYTSLHIEKYKIEIRETPFGFEEITRQIPNQEQKNIQQLDDKGVIKVGSWVEEGDILVGRTTPIRQKTLLPHEKLLYDIVGKEAPPIRNTSLRVPRGVAGRIINVQILEAKTALQKTCSAKIESVYIYILEYKKIKIGDKIAGRHGNKGIVSKILKIEDCPYYPDGTTIDMVLNPLGVPSRMNIGQIFESLLGLIGYKLHQKFKILPFDEIYGYEASRSLVFYKLYEASAKRRQKWIFSPKYPGKFRLFDGRTGLNFKYPIMSGVSYMMKLIHLVDEKIHARSTGSYSLVTQQPLRGRSKHGGQRFGEMEVWALEGFGVSYTLQELLTVKSDDVKGRTQIMESILKNSTLHFGTPESFKVLVRELQALCLDVQLYNQKISYYMK